MSVGMSLKTSWRERVAKILSQCRADFRHTFALNGLDSTYISPIKMTAELQAAALAFHGCSGVAAAENDIVGDEEAAVGAV